MADRARRIGLVAFLAASVVTSPVRGTAEAEQLAAGVTTPAAATHYVALSAPRRVVDSRIGLGTEATPITADGSRDLTITGTYVPADATAVMVNVTAARITGTGFLQVFPTGEAVLGKTSSLNVEPHLDALPTAAFIPLGTNGRVTVYSTFRTDVLVDVFGYFTPVSVASEGRFVPLTPRRIFDSRTAIVSPGDAKNCTDFTTYADAKEWYDAFFAQFGDVARLDDDGDGIPCESFADAPSLPTAPTQTTMPAATSTTVLVAAPRTVTRTRSMRVPKLTPLTIPVAGLGGVPTGGVGSVVLNVTAVEPTANGYVQVAPTPVSPGATSNLNTTRGITMANLVVVPLGPSGSVDLFTDVSTDLLVDVIGYFTDSTVAPGSSGLFVPISPERLLDTRSGSRPGAHSTRTVDVGRVAPWATAVAGTVTATEAEPGWVQVAGSPVDPGKASSLNIDLADQTIANAVISPVGANHVDLYTDSPSHLLVDITGWFTT